MSLFARLKALRDGALDRLARKELARCGPDTVLACRVNRHLGGHIEVGTGSYVMGILQTHVPDSRLVIGDNVMVNARTVIESYSSVTVGHDALIAFDVVISDCQHHSLDWTDRQGDYQLWRATGTGNHEVMRGDPVVIEDGVWIGGRSIVLPGVTIGRGTTVGAGSVVTKDIPEFSIAVGNPARVVGEVPPTEPDRP